MRKNGQIKNCLYCNKEIYVQLHLIKLGKGKYCSQNCHSKKMKGSPPKNITGFKLGWGWNKGKKYLQIRGEKNYLWKDEKVSYSGLHHWVARELGKPPKCELCGKDNLSGKFIQWANKSGEYKRDLTDWIRLCAMCHKNFDMGRGTSSWAGLI